MRISPVHYIAPSAVSITPNANQSPRDLAVHVARGTKIKVCYQPIADLGYNDANYKEWTLRGRNRRLAESGVPYTIYARLNKTDQADGYLVFAQKEHDDETDEWNDPYILSPNTSATSAIRLEGADGAKYLWSAIPERQAASGRSDYWWIRLGSVSAPDSTGQRSVDFDSGILGTAQYNMDWYLNPDNLPTRPVREIFVDRGEWTAAPTATYTGSSGKATPDGTLDAAVAAALGWEGTGELSFENGQQIAEPYHCRRLTRDRWLTHRLADYEAGYTDAELYEKLTTPSYGWEEENWVETSRVWYNGRMWECLKEGTAEEPGENSKDWRRLLQSGEDGADGYSVELTKSSDSAVIDPSGNVIGGYRNVSKDASQNEFYSYRFFTSVTVMRGGEYLHLCGALDDDEQLGEGNFTVEAIGAGCDLKVEGSTVYITGIWHCNDGDSSTPNTSYSESPEEYQLMRTMTEAVAHITLNIEGKTAVTKDYRLQLVHLPTDTVVIESHNEVSAINWSTKKNNWTNQADIEIPLTASSGGQPVRFQTVNGGDAPDIRLLNTPGWLINTPGYSVAWADYDEDGDGRAEYTAAQHMAVKITIPIRNIRRTWTETGIGKSIDNSNLLRFNVTTVVDGVEYENIVPFTLNVTTDKAVYVLAPSVRQVIGTMIGGTWDKQSKTISSARYSYSAGGQECSVVKCSLMAYDDNNAMTEITSEADIHDSLTFLLNGKPSTLAEFRAGLANTAVTGENHTLYDELSEIVFAIRLDGKDYESEGVPILRNGAQISIGDNGNWYVGGVNTEVFAKGTEVIDTKIYYTDPMDGSTPPAYAPTEAQRGKPVSPYLKTQCPASVEGKFIHYVSITIFSDSEETYVYSYGTIGTGNTITVIHDRDYYASAIELTQAQLRAVDESKWSESTPADYSSDNKYLYSRDAARYYKNGAEQTVTVGGISYPKIVYTLLSYWGQDGSGVEFAYYRADDESAAKKPTADVLNQRHAGTAKNPVIPDWNGSDGGWYDDNPGFTAQGQVMYQSVNKYSNGQWSGWGDPVIIDRYAQNSVRLDIDNEMDMVATDSTGQITAARTVETVVCLYDGSKEVDISAATLTVAGAPGSAIATQTAAASGKGKKLSWAFKAGQPMADVYNISIAYTYNGTAYTAAFTVSASKGQAVWQLKPSMSSIAFQRTASNALIPASRDVSLKLVKIDGASTTEYSSVQTGVAVRYSTSSMPASDSAGTAWTSGNISVPNTADNLYVALFNAAGTLLDRETVPVVKDGENGQNSVHLDIDNEHQDFLYDDTGNNLTGSVTFYPMLYDGTSDRSGSVEEWQVSANDGTDWDSSTGSHSGDTMTASINAGNRLITVSGLKASTAKLLVRALYQGTYYYAEFTANRASQDTYELVLNPSSIAYNPANYAQKTISISATRLDLSGRRSSVAFGTGEGNISTVAGRGTLRLYATYGITTVQITTGSFSVTASLAAASTSVYLELRKYSGTAYTIVDYETIPINKAENGKDGGDGQNAVSYKISCVDTIKPGDDYFNVSIIRSDGASVSRKDLLHAKNDWGVTLSCTGLAGAVVEDSEDSQVNVSNCTITGSTTLILRLMLSGVIVDEKHVRGVIDGADGNPGHVGRWYYYAEEWASGNTYAMQETQAPFVKRHTTINGVEADYFFMLDFGTRGISTGSTRGEDPASHYNPVSGQGTEPWTLMQSTMQYYIAQAFFGPYAHFGSFIINSDWLVSTNGKIGDTEYVAGSQYGGAPAYLCFDSRSPFGPRTIGVWSSAGTSFYNTAYNQKCDGFYVGCSTLNLWVSATLTGGTMSLAVYSSDGVKVSGDFELTGAGDVNVVAVGLDRSKSYHLRAKMSSSSYRGTISRITEYPFVPNFAVDGLTGKTYQNDAYVRGTVKARLFYGETLNVGGESPYTIDLDNNPYYTYFVPGGYPDNQEIILPAPEKYDGCELKFFMFPSPTRATPSYILKGKLMFLDKDNLYRPTAAEELYGPAGEFLIIKSFDGYWMVVSGIL